MKQEKIVPENIIDLCFNIFESIISSIMFCLTHRLPEQHNCPHLVAHNKDSDDIRSKEQAVKIEKQKLVSDLLGNSTITGNTSTKPVKKKTLSDKERKRAAKVRCMKLRSTAKGPTHVPQADRVYFEICHESKSQNVFVDRHFSVGRIISSAAGSCSFKITHLATESQFPLEPNEELISLLELGLVLNGDKLIAH